MVSACLVAGVVYMNYVAAPSRPVESVKAGDVLPDVPGLDFGSHSKTLVIVLKEGCPYCEGSSPFYRELQDLERSGDGAVGLVAVFNDPLEVASRALRTQELQIRLVGGVRLDQWKINVIPTLLMVDGRRRVLSTWEGLLTRKAESEVKAALQRSKS